MRLAELLKVEQPLVSQWLSGTARPGSVLRTTIRSLCGIPEEYWLDAAELSEVARISKAAS